MHPSRHAAGRSALAVGAVGVGAVGAAAAESAGEGAAAGDQEAGAEAAIATKSIVSCAPSVEIVEATSERKTPFLPLMLLRTAQTLVGIVP